MILAAVAGPIPGSASSSAEVAVLTFTGPARRPTSRGRARSATGRRADPR